MSDPKPTVYEADPHTRAKHRILKAYALTNTPAYKYLEALRVMEREGQLRPVSPPPARRAGSFGDFPDMLVEVRRVIKHEQAGLFG